MGKGMIIVVGLSCGVMALFCIFSYLMTTINPAPISTAKPDLREFTNVPKAPASVIALRAETSTIPSFILRARDDNEKSNSDGEVAYLKDFLSKQIGALGYGLEKAEPRRNIDTTKQQPNPINKFIETTKSSYYYFVPDPRRSLNPTRDDIKKIPTNNETIIRNQIAVPFLKKKSVSEERERRCISEIKPKTGAIVFKMIDDTGSTRLTIKVEADAFENTNIINENYDILEGKTEEQKHQNRDNVIKIFPNNSLSLDKRDEPSFFIDFASKHEVILKINKRTLEIMRNVSSTSSAILQTLRNNDLVLYNATNSTSKKAD